MRLPGAEMSRAAGAVPPTRGGPVPAASHSHSLLARLNGWRSRKETALLARTRDRRSASFEPRTAESDVDAPERRSPPERQSPFERPQVLDVSERRREKDVSPLDQLRIPPPPAPAQPSRYAVARELLAEEDVNGNLVMKYRGLLPSQARGNAASRSLSLDRGGEPDYPGYAGYATIGRSTRPPPSAAEQRQWQFSLPRNGHSNGNGHLRQDADLPRNGHPERQFSLPRSGLENGHHQNGQNGLQNGLPKAGERPSRLRSFADQISLLDELTKAWDSAASGFKGGLSLRPSRLVTSLGPYARPAKEAPAPSRLVRFASKDDVLSYASGGSGAGSPPLAKPEQVEDDPFPQTNGGGEKRHGGALLGAELDTVERAMPGIPGRKSVTASPNSAIGSSDKEEEQLSLADSAVSPSSVFPTPTSLSAGLGISSPFSAHMPAFFKRLRRKQEPNSHWIPDSNGAVVNGVNGVSGDPKDPHGDSLGPLPTLRSRLRASLRRQRPPSTISEPSFERRHTITHVHHGETREERRLLFLQQGSETKRALLPGGGLRNLTDILNLFARTFPASLHHQDLHSPATKIYIQDPEKPEIFYELEDVNEVKDRCVLRLRDQKTAPPTSNSSMSSPFTTNHRSDAEDMSYFSEPELEVGARKPYFPSSTPYYTRPASTLPIGSRAAPPKPSYLYPGRGGSLATRGLHPPPGGVFRSASDTEGGGGLGDRESDRSSTTSSLRSGSITPIIDEEARARVVEMENQLSSLSSLVHSALVSKGPNDSVFKDLEMLRREILGSGLGTRDSDMASEAGSVSTRYSDLASSMSRDWTVKGKLEPVEAAKTAPAPSTHRQNNNHSPPTKDEMRSPLGGADVRTQLRGLKSRTGELQAECRHIRRLAQLNAQSTKEMLASSFAQIRALVQSREGASPERVAVQTAAADHKDELTRIEGGLTDFERTVEELRRDVVNGQRRLRLSEVEDFTNTLTDIGQSAAGLKGDFPGLQTRLKRLMSAEMERVVREEKFLKEEPSRLDSALRRCKKLTKTMLTMKKLAMVQDPHAGPRPQAPAFAPVEPSSGPVPPIPPPPPGYGDREKTPTEKRSESHHVLDSLLEELQTVGSRPGGLNTLGRGEPTLRVNGVASIPRAQLAKSSSGSGPFSSSLSLPRQPERSRSGTPSSVASEPVGPRKAAPPPPPRSSSRNSTRNLLLKSPLDPGTFSDGELGDFRSYLRSNGGGPKGPIVHTDALSADEAESRHIAGGGVPRLGNGALKGSGGLRSASSSESINSQESLQQPPHKPPPPPPPPRNRAELAAQREEERSRGPSYPAGLRGN